MTAGDQQEKLTMLSVPESPDDQSKGLSRLISQEELTSMANSLDRRSPHYVSGCEDNDETSSKRSGSPMRCVSEFDEVTNVSKSDSEDDGKSASAPRQPNPLSHEGFRLAHVKALRLEAELQPMRMILGRLMAHPVNKKGLFNAPVDAVALGLLDYHEVIQKPMDLGTVKAKLYSIAYQSRQDVADDVWLVFSNAMKYNPPKNPVHVAARSLQDLFDELYIAVGGGSSSTKNCASASASISQTPEPMRRVSFADTMQVVECQPSMPNKPGSDALVRSVSSEGGISCSAVQCDSTPTGSGHTSSSQQPIGQQPQALPTGCGSPQSTRAKNVDVPSVLPFIMKPQKKRRLSFAGKKTSGHSCRACRGRDCMLCEQSCLPLEPTLLLCSGTHCTGAKIRKGAVYYISKDGSRQYCQRCFASLPAVLPQVECEDDSIRYKCHLLKRKNDEEVVEEWLTCVKCEGGVHKVCAMHNTFAHASDGFLCPNCDAAPSESGNAEIKAPTADRNPSGCNAFTFLTGSEVPVPVAEVVPEFHLEGVPTADTLPHNALSVFIEEKVRERLTSCEIPCVDKTVSVRVISDCDRHFKVPDVVRKHFRMATEATDDKRFVVSPPKQVSYRSKAIALFQKSDGLDICIFCMYVQEYVGNDVYDEDLCQGVSPKSKKRVYIAYLDSVEHFRPRSARTQVYHELLVSYLASARQRGFESAHIWACPPSRGNSFVFRNHPASQRTPSSERLIAWYHGAISRAIECGIVTDVKSLYESDFQESSKEMKNANQGQKAVVHPCGKMFCPPLLDGDFWIDEAVRIHAASLARHLKAKLEANNSISAEADRVSLDPCPARQIGFLLSDRVMAHESAAPFRRPVNAAAMKLKDYHKIVTKPMDLGTVYSRCVHGEYHNLGELVSDVELVFSNAKKFNPPGHFVFNMAVEMEDLFFKLLDDVTSTWNAPASGTRSWKDFAEISMSLDMTLRQREAAGNVTDYDSSSTDDIESSTDDSKPCDEDMEMQGVIKGSSNHSDSRAEQNSSKMETQEFSVDLLTGGPDAVSQRMAGEDKWMIEKKGQMLPKRPSVSKKGGVKRRRSSVSGQVEDGPPASKRRRQTWLGEEVGESVRSMRTSFFTCSLTPVPDMSKEEMDKVSEFARYTKCYKPEEMLGDVVISSRIVDARQSVLEFSQYRNLEFSTLRHAKYSTAILLYHLHNHDAPGMIPACSSCQQETRDCRWHKIVRVEELRKSPKKKPGRPATTVVEDKSKYHAEELCSDCHATHTNPDQFIPIPVTFSSS